MDLTVPVRAGDPRHRGPRLTTALTAARTAAWLSRHLTGGAGHAIGGRTLLALDPEAPESLAAGRSITLVTGTNGKTTTTAMVAAALGTQALTGSNADGGNTPVGLVSTLSDDPADQLVLEVDEGWLPWAVARLQPRCVVLLNLSRDQLHRHPEVHRLAATWRSALAGAPLVVANADDPAVVWAAGAARERLWVAAGLGWTQDSMTCPECGGLVGRAEHSWRCACGFRRPSSVWSVANGRVRHHGQDVGVELSLPGDANLGNAALALAAAVTSGVSPDAAARAVGGLREVAGRYAVVRHGRHAVRLLLAKNPAGWDAALRAVEASTAPLVVSFNADGVDGRDPSWLYDVSFDRLAGRTIAVCGRRGTDMLVRLRVDGLAPVGQFESLDGALRALPPGPVDVVANYTAFQQARRVLDRAA
jgi:UDP-N-acetylmuramyl tripeptide synthase